MTTTSDELPRLLAYRDALEAEVIGLRSRLSALIEEVEAGVSLILPNRSSTGRYIIEQAIARAKGDA